MMALVTENFPPGLSIGPMSDAEIATLGDWAAAEGWNPGLADLGIARACDPDAFIALRRDEELAGGGAIFSYDGNFGFMGLFIVRKDLRGDGLGAKLWHYRRDRLLQRLKPGASIGMDGVFAMVKFYERGGFRFAYRDLRFEGIARGKADPASVPLSTLPFAAIDRFDREFFPVPRSEFLRRWVKQPGAHAQALVEDGNIVAFGVARPCHSGFKIGPAFAKSSTLAERLLSSLMGAIDGEKVQLDIPEPNDAGLALAARFGLTESFGCARLYHGPIPSLPLDHIFGVTSFEFG
jgi:GNAT superfamily N-acetyltransferase